MGAAGKCCLLSQHFMMASDTVQKADQAVAYPDPAAPLGTVQEHSLAQRSMSSNTAYASGSGERAGEEEGCWRWRAS